VYVPGAVPKGTATLAVIFAGADDVGLTMLEGVSIQVAPAMGEVQETVTLWLNEPAAVI
jgi:hypothetical protein